MKEHTRSDIGTWVHSAKWVSMALFHKERITLMAHVRKGTNMNSDVKKSLDAKTQYFDEYLFRSRSTRRPIGIGPGGVRASMPNTRCERQKGTLLRNRNTPTFRVSSRAFRGLLSVLRHLPLSPWQKKTSHPSRCLVSSRNGRQSR